MEDCDDRDGIEEEKAQEALLTSEWMSENPVRSSLDQLVAHDGRS